MLNELWHIFCVIGLVFGKIQNDIFPPLPIAFRTSENVVCRQHSEKYLDNLSNFTLWAYEMRDASAKSTVGILRGSIFNMGDFTQCLTSRAPFPTQYCLTIVTANVPVPKTSRNPYSIHFEPNDHLLDKLYIYEDISKLPRNGVKMGWCIPASCTPSELQKYLNEYLSKLDYTLKKENVTYAAQVPQILCTSSNSSRVMDSIDILFCMLTVVLVLLVIISTCWDFNQEFDKSIKKSFLFKMLMAFSARKNFSDLSKAESSDEALTMLYGIKTFSIFMIIIDHRFGMVVGGAISNFDFIEAMYRNTLVSYIFHGDLFVDTFFVVSGLLVVYTLLSMFDKKFVNPGFIIFMRYLRLTPAYAFVLFFACTTTFYQTGNGPLWNAIVGNEVADCRRTWWTNLLYISNYVDTEHMAHSMYKSRARTSSTYIIIWLVFYSSWFIHAIMEYYSSILLKFICDCMAHTWYLPCDLHYFIIAVGLVLLLKKERTYGLAAVLGLTIISVIIPFVLILIYERPAFLRFYPDFLSSAKTHPDYKLIYTKSHTRATPYFIGMFAGYTYYKLKGSGRILSKWFTTTLLLVSAFLLTACVFTGIVFYDPFYGYNALESATYGSLHRPVWALGTFGFMYATSYGSYSFLHKCLSWRPWVPLSKLVFGAYLWHFIFQLRTLGKINSPVVFNFFDVISYGISDICLAFMLALGLYLTVEAPVRRILKEIFLPSKPEINESRKESELPVNNEVNNSDCRTKI